MQKEKQILEEVDKTLSSLDDLPTLQPNPFLFTRLQNKLANEDLRAEKSILGNLRFRTVALVVILILNIMTVVTFFNKDKRDYSKEQLISSLNNDYNSTQDDF
jgi:hypothetical protein